MRVAREKALTVVGVLNEKIYVMGGCKAEETTNWAEVFDTKTQTWEALPDPGAELRFSLLKTMRMIKGKVYVENSEKKHYVYDPKEGKWDVAPLGGNGIMECKVENVRVRNYLRTRRFFWYDKKRKEWRVVKGLEAFNRNVPHVIITLTRYCGKLLILWEKLEQPGGQCQNKNIWCSVIKLERRNGDDEVWGTVEWASVVLTVPSSYVFLRCLVRSV
ncbi:unnamed protein product [Microthlaspi erraticum]|uniref:FKB95-like N-terminal Kelch domain-containing protein n=1 Tax=Microthlaspi erraticum TaxID=1685480 RepID=A0A6D2KDI0_9BRAS|nr:unnamed protein product [Microthlaspi erraticum]